MKLVDAIEAIKKTGLAVTISVEDQPALEIKISGKTVNLNIKKPDLVGKLAKKTGLL